MSLAVKIRTSDRQKQPFADVLQNRCFKKFRNIARKIPLLKFLFNQVAGLQTCNFIKKKLQHKCFPANIAKFSEQFFYRAPLMAASGSHNQRMNLTSIITTLQYTWHKLNLHITFARRLWGLLHVIRLLSLRPVFRGMRNEINAVLLLSDSYHFFYYSHDRLDIYIKQGAVWKISIFFVILLPISGLTFLCSKPFTEYF